MGRGDGPIAASGAVRRRSPKRVLKQLFKRRKLNASVTQKPDRTAPNNWHKDGMLHREDGPAVIEPNGTQKWCNNGMLHREGGPAVTRPAGIEIERFNTPRIESTGKRLEFPAARAMFALSNRLGAKGYAPTEEWYRRDKMHREDGPAIVFENGAEVFFKDGLAHREDGPAIISPNGTKEWWRDGKPVEEPPQS